MFEKLCAAYGVYYRKFNDNNNKWENDCSVQKKIKMNNNSREMVTNHNQIEFSNEQ